MAELRINLTPEIEKRVRELEKFKYHGAKRHAEDLRRFLVATAGNIKALIVLLIRRLTLMRELESLPNQEQKQTSLETLEIYAPLARRLGIGKIVAELEDLSFKYLEPEKYAETLKLSRERIKLTEKSLEHIYRTLIKKLAEEKIPFKKIDKRTKGVWSLYKKLERREGNVEKIYDILALRVVTMNVDDCYRSLGLAHRLWRPVPGEFDDYIASPKLNGYQSLHTAVFTGEGLIVEIQIRTEAMHDEAERGIASHLGYAESGKPGRGGALPKKLEWVKKLTETQNPAELFEGEIFVFTPKGDVIELPAGATVIDFAYAVHSQIGQHANGGRINGKFVSLDTGLIQNDVVEIITSKNAKPSRKWLQFAQTQEAQRRIKVRLKNY